MRARAANQVNRVMLYAWLHARSAHLAAAAGNSIRISKRLDVNFVQSSGMKPGIPVCHYLPLMLFARIVEKNFQHEAIELGLRQRIGSFILNRVFRRQHSKDRREYVPFAVNSYLPLFH